MFNNIALVVSFLVDALYFGRAVYLPDIAGSSLIVLFSALQGYLANLAVEKEKEQLMEQEGNLTDSADEDAVVEEVPFLGRGSKS